MCGGGGGGGVSFFLAANLRCGLENACRPAGWAGMDWQGRLGFNTNHVSIVTWRPESSRGGLGVMRPAGISVTFYLFIYFYICWKNAWKQERKGTAATDKQPPPHPYDLSGDKFDIKRTIFWPEFMLKRVIFEWMKNNENTNYVQKKNTKTVSRRDRFLTQISLANPFSILMLSVFPQWRWYCTCFMLDLTQNGW